MDERAEVWTKAPGEEAADWHIYCNGIWRGTVVSEAVATRILTALASNARLAQLGRTESYQETAFREVRDERDDLRQRVKELEFKLNDAPEAPLTPPAQTETKMLKFYTPELSALIQRMCSEPCKSPLEEMFIDAFMEICDGDHKPAFPQGVNGPCLICAKCAQQTAILTNNLCPKCAAPLSQDAQKETAPSEQSYPIDVPLHIKISVPAQSSEKPPAEKVTPDLREEIGKILFNRALSKTLHGHSLETADEIVALLKRLRGEGAKVTPKLSPREWVIQGGGGNEDGEHAFKCCTLSMGSAVELIEEYVEYLRGEGE